MDAFIQSYDLDFASFQEVLQHANAYIAGNVALSLYLQENGMSSYEPDDMDIFLNGSCDILVSYLTRYGYADKTLENEQGNKYSTMEYVVGSNTFVKDKKKIQIIVLCESQNVTEYISCQFDLSVCATWWNPTENQLVTLNPEYTLKKKMYLNNAIARNYYNMTEKLQTRIKKYIAYGFKYMFVPGENMRIYENKDCRKNLIQSILTGTKAFDVCEYEDVDCIPFLQQSSWNIIIKTGKQLQAFHRNVLVTYMVDHPHTLVDGDIVFSTPTQQCIYGESLKTLLHGDYSIFEFVSPVTHTDKKGDLQTVYSINCYTVDQWNTGILGMIVRQTRHCLYDNEQYYENVYDERFEEEMAANMEENANQGL
jgi:hypothetical protein